LQGECERDALGREAEAAVFGQAVEDLGQALPLPQPAEHQRRPPGLGVASDEAFVPGGLDHLEAGAEAGERLEELIELAGGDEQIAAAEAGHELLADSSAVPLRAHDLQVLVALSVLDDWLDPHEHRRLIAACPSSVNSKPITSSFCHYILVVGLETTCLTH
jgi:hypothetical protein